MDFPIHISRVKGRKAILDMNDGAINPDHAYNMVWDAVRDDCKNFINESLLWDCFYIAGGGIKFEYFKTEKGARITTVLKNKLVHAFKDRKLSNVVKKFEEAWPNTARKIKALYYDKQQVLAFFAPKNLLGEGVFEPHKTCLREDTGEYHLNGDFFRQYRRGKMLALAVIKDNHIYPESWGGGRCLLHFKGGHKIVATNFYYNKLVNNKQLFIDGLNKMFNMNGTIENHFDHAVDLPIYLNGGALKIDYGPNRPIWSRQWLWPCPHCGAEIKHKHFNFDVDSLDLGCDNCYPNGHSIICENCGDRVNEDNSYVSEGGYNYCESCYNDLFTLCYSCDREAHRDDVFSWNDHDYCDRCKERLFVDCSNCGETVYHNNAESYEGNDYCSTCYDEILEREEEEKEAA